MRGGNIVIFLFPINTVLGGFVTTTTCSTILIYIVPSLVPFLDKSCPYRTPLTDALSAVSWLLSLFGAGKNAHTLPQWTTSKRQMPDDDATKMSFLTPKRMKFVWARTSAYLLNREGFGSLANYVAVIVHPQ